ncbi:OB-fold nucleic acid binding domain-containing protein [Schlesneria paludicola]|uniref:OB-fold nucleic acid binding domain-containing protein n=1 Tax=Schlesneria paludicola TaxID=360056 RepID=UPI00029A84DE|nr:OB-fold nucleic acid binding domain-containing protein [Schlesneria paludicola]
MLRKTWTKSLVALALGAGLSGWAIQSYVVGQEPQKQREHQLATTTETVSGRVKALLKNDRGDTDGLAMENGASIHFPPHMSESVTKLVQIGDRIEARGHEQTRKNGETVFEAEQIGKGGESIEIKPPRPPRGGPRGPKGPRESDEPMTVTATVREFHSNRHGDVDGLILSDGTEVKVPPHQGAELQEFAKIGSEVRVEGRRHETPHGDIHLHADRVASTSSGRTFERDEPHHGHHEPPHVEILRELREVRRLLESMQKKST